MSVHSTSTSERSLDRQHILEEDDYTAALSRIIARDFFPSLAHLHDSIESNGFADSHLDPAFTPAVTTRDSSKSSLCTPLYPTRIPSLPQDRRPLKKPETELSLDSFQARYTSEDNSSFTHILESENETRRERWSWAWDAQKRVDENQNKMITMRSKMLLEPPSRVGVREKFVIEAPTPLGLLTAGIDPAIGPKPENGIGNHRAQDPVSSNATEDEQRDVMAPTKDTRSAGVDGWGFKARNHLMFPPDADESPHQLASLNDTTADLKIIKYGNTRFGGDGFMPASLGSSTFPSPTRSRIDAAIAGSSYSQPPPSSFGLVPNLPSPTASELGPTAVKQLMTWGTLNATPRIISQSDDPVEQPSAFRLPPISHREAISQKLSNKASKSLRAKANLLGLTPGIPRSLPIALKKKTDMGPPTRTPRRPELTGNLTPAAKQLLNRTTMGTVAARRVEKVTLSSKEKDLSRVQWTPAPEVAMK